MESINKSKTTWRTFFSKKERIIEELNPCVPVENRRTKTMAAIIYFNVLDIFLPTMIMRNKKYFVISISILIKDLDDLSHVYAYIYNKEKT